MNHATHKEVKAAYSFYNVTGEEHSVSLVDLMAGYRQIPVNHAHQFLLFGAYWDLDAREVRVAEHLGAPFGARAVVNSFKACQVAILFVVVRYGC